MPSSKTAHLIVIGSPGHGKSTFLNEIAGVDEPLFKTGGDRGSCTQLGQGAADTAWTDEDGTQWENERTLKIKDKDEEYDLHVVDTPGFPDPDRAKAKDYYNHVVKKCSTEINGVVFVVKPERLCMDLIERYSTLLREFSFLDVPLVIMVNGTEPARRKESEEAYQKKRSKTVASFLETAKDIAKAAQLQPRDIFVSYTLDEIAKFGTDIAKILAFEKPKSSKLRTYDQIKEALAEAEVNDEAAKKEQIQYCEATKRQAKRNMEHAIVVEQQMRELAKGNLDQVNDLVNLLYGLAAMGGLKNAENCADDNAEKAMQLKQQIEAIDKEIEHIKNYTPAELLDLKKRVKLLTKFLVGGD